MEISPPCPFYSPPPPPPRTQCGPAVFSLFVLSRNQTEGKEGTRRLRGIFNYEALCGGVFFFPVPSFSVYFRVRQRRATPRRLVVIYCSFADRARARVLNYYIVSTCRRAAAPFSDSDDSGVFATGDSRGALASTTDQMEANKRAIYNRRDIYDYFVQSFLLRNPIYNVLNVYVRRGAVGSRIIYA